jgi:hypothetical protein
MFPITYSHRNDITFNRVVFTDDWGPFRKGDKCARLTVDIVDQRIFYTKDGYKWENPTPFRLVPEKGAVDVRTTGDLRIRGFLRKLRDLLRR